MSCIGNLYSKSILVRLTNSKSEDRFKSIHITVDYQTNTQPTHKTELIIKLTDELDPFFLYSLYMSEEDYQTLKVQQGLLVDFSAFGQRFIDLLCACEKDEKSDNPKFQLQFYSKEPLPYDHGHASLNVIEINPFKHLCHLSLNFMPGNDADVKKYLATCLKTLRDDYTKLSRVYEETKSSLSQKLESAQQMLSHKSVEIDKLRVELDAQSEKLITKHMQELNFERDKSLQNQYANQQKYDKEKKEIELNLMKTIKQMESRLNELEAQNKDLLEKKYKNESQLQEFRLRNTSLQEEFNVIKNELLTIRKQNTQLDSELHSNDKLTNQLRTKIAVLEQELKDKVDAFNRGQDSLNNEQSQRKILEDALKDKSNDLKKKQAEINHYVEEFKKGNEIVIKLQNREKTLVGQIKLKSRILTEQEKVMKEKEKEIEDLKVEIKEIRNQTTSLTDENKDLKTSLQKKTLELEEAAKLLKRDENIISWLNKQITDNNIQSSSLNKIGSYESHTLGNSGVGGGGGGGVLFKPFGTLNSNPTNLLNGNHLTASTNSLGGSGGLINSNNNNNNLNQIDSSLNMMRISNGSNNSTNLINQQQYLNKSNEIDNNRRLLMQNNSNNNSNNINGNYQFNNYQQRALSSASGSSIQQQQQLQQQQQTNENQEIESPTLNNRLNGSSGDLTTGNNVNSKNSTASTRLDPKYFQSNSPTLTNGLDHLVALRPQLNTRPGLTATTNTGRLNKQLIQNGHTNNAMSNAQVNQPMVTTATQLSSSSSSSSSSSTASSTSSSHGQYNSAATSSKPTPSLASAYFPTN